jgi:bacteriocin-like protein
MVPSQKQERDMNMNYETHELNDAELNEVSGGMDCRSAIAVAQVYVSVAGVLGALGDSAGSAYFSGQAKGVLQGGCPK